MSGNGPWLVGDGVTCCKRRRSSKRANGRPLSPADLSIPSFTPALQRQHDMDITAAFNQCLAAQNSRPVEPHIFRLQELDEFLKEAYRIVCHVARREADD